MFIPRVGKCKQYEELHVQSRSCIRGVMGLFVGTSVTDTGKTELANLEISMILSKDSLLQGFLSP